MSRKTVVKDGTKYRKVHLYVEEDLYYKLWEIIKQRFRVPHRKLYIVINEALREYIERHSEKIIRERAL